MPNSESNFLKRTGSRLINRRELFHLSTRLVVAGCACQQFRSAALTAPATCCSTPILEPESLVIGDEFLAIDLGKAASIAAVPSAACIVEPDKQIQLIVVRRAKHSYAALSRLCTHASQTISYVAKRGLLQCNGFNHSLFDLEGRLVKGPAESSLKSYAVVLNGTTLTIARGQEVRP
jgi:nitrite reductase/ring-hydroxylating ferredoxin subunit